MRRLREEIDSSDPAVVRAATILAAASPLDADRFWNVAFPAQRARRPPVLSLRATALVAVSLGSFAASAAVVPHLHAWNAPWAVIHEVTGPQANAAPVTAPREARPPPEAVRTESEIEATEDDMRTPSPPRVPPRAAKTPSRAAPTLRATNAAPKSAPAEVVQPDGESALMVEAVRALRRDRDPARALSLAETAMDRYPRGAQAEEAMALGMEAASATGDDATAHRLAERYLTSFRGGHFADRAQQIVSAPLR